MATTLFIKHAVQDYSGWKRVYDSLGTLRKEKYGVLGASVHRDSNDPNSIVITHRFSNVSAAMAFVSSDDLRAAMGDAGVISQPELWFADDVEQTAY